jgi:hypothetical protein
MASPLTTKLLSHGIGGDAKRLRQRDAAPARQRQQDRAGAIRFPAHFRVRQLLQRRYMFRRRRQPGSTCHASKPS